MELFVLLQLDSEAMFVFLALDLGVECLMITDSQFDGSGYLIVERFGAEVEVFGFLEWLHAFCTRLSRTRLDGHGCSDRNHHKQRNLEYENRNREKLLFSGKLVQLRQRN